MDQQSKLKNTGESEQCKNFIYRVQEDDDEADQERNKQKTSHQFVKIKIKQQIYSGEPVLVVFISDLTNKVYNEMKNKKENEEKTELHIAQSQSSTVSHELATPLSSIIYFVKTLMMMLTGTIAEDPVIEKYFKLILMQLIVQQVFVDNLLDV